MQDARRGLYHVGGRLQNTLANQSFQVALPAGSTAQNNRQQLSPGSQKVPKLLGQMSDANESNLPAGTLVKQLKEEPQWPQMDAGGRGDTRQAHTTLPLSALPASDYFYPSGFPEPSIVSVIHQPSMKLFQLLILSPLKAVNFLQASPASSKDLLPGQRTVLDLN